MVGADTVAVVGDRVVGGGLFAPAGVVGVTPVVNLLESFLGPLTGLVISAAIFLVVMLAAYVLNKSVFN